jgi:hypothetical protein
MSVFPSFRSDLANRHQSRGGHGCNNTGVTIVYI